MAVEWAKALAPVAGSLVSGLFGKEGQEDANQANREMAFEQMRFQREMASTQYRRAVKDMKKAGLNPILAVARPAAAPAGAMAVAQNTMSGFGGLGAAANSAVSLGMQQEKQEYELMNLLAQAHVGNYQAAKIFAEITTEWARTELVQAQGDLTREQVLNLETLRKKLDKETLRILQQIRIAENDEARAAAEQDFYETEAGGIIRQLGIAIQNLLPFLRSGKK